MQVREFVQSGTAEYFKGGVHAAATMLIGAMALYNLVAWCHRREHHLGINAIVYGLGMTYEVIQTTRHVTKETVHWSEVRLC